VKKVVYALLILTLVLAACGGDDSERKDPSPGPSNAAQNDASTYEGKKIVWLDSYHEGYAWSDGIQAGIESVLKNTGVELLILRMDTKHVLDDEGRKAAADRVRAEIDAFKPDVIIATDDDAQRYVIVPFYKDTATPVVFAGVNNDATPYGYPASNVTGMVEIDLAEHVVEQMRPYMKGPRIALLSDDTTTSYRMGESYAKRFPDLTVVKYTNSYDEFKQLFVELQDQADLLLVYNNTAITGWDEADMRAFVLENTRIPTAGVLEWMSPYLVMVMGLVAQEQGSWAASTALSIIDGTPVSDIPVTKNKEGVVYVNLDLAAKLDMALPPVLLRNAITISATSPGSAN